MDVVGFDVIRKSSVKINKGTVIVFLATYNRADKIIRSINSIIKQQYVNIVLHVVDDCSSDDTIKVVSDYIDKNKINNIVLTKANKNNGKYFNLNYCLFKHRLDDYGYWTCQDSDDVSKPRRIIEMVNAIKNSKLCSVAHTYERKTKGIYNGIGVALILYKKRVFNKLGYYDNIRFGADSEYYERFVKNISEVKRLKGNHFYWADYDDDCLTSIHKREKRRKYVLKYRLEIEKGLIKRGWVGQPKVIKKVDEPKLIKKTNEPKLIKKTNEPKLIKKTNEPKLIKKVNEPKLIKKLNNTKLKEPKLIKKLNNTKLKEPKLIKKVNETKKNKRVDITLFKKNTRNK